MNKEVLTLVAIAFGSVAFAQQPPPRSPPQQPREAAPPQQRPGSNLPQNHPLSFDVVDKNKDGRISREEANAVPGINFAKADADGNSSLDREEYDIMIASLSSPPRG